MLINILAYKNLQSTNALAYRAAESVTKKESFITLTRGHLEVTDRGFESGSVPQAGRVYRKNRQQSNITR